MNGTILYGPKGRLLAAISYVSMLILSMQLGGMFQFIPPKVAAVILAIGATSTAFSERLTGGASNRKVRIEAQQSDNQNELDVTNR